MILIVGNNRLLSCRMNGVQLGFSKAVVGFTMPSTDQSHISCSSGGHSTISSNMRIRLSRIFWQNDVFFLTSPNLFRQKYLYFFSFMQLLTFIFVENTWAHLVACVDVNVFLILGRLDVWNSCIKILVWWYCAVYYACALFHALWWNLAAFMVFSSYKLKDILELIIATIFSLLNAISFLVWIWINYRKISKK